LPPPDSNDLSRRFWRLTALNIFTNLTVPLASLVDTALLGHLRDIRFLAGVSLASVLFDYVYWTFGFLRMGTTGITAQAFGVGRRREVYRILYRSLLLALCLGCLILLFRLPLRELGFTLLSGSESVELAGRDYFDARIWGAPAALLNFAFLGWFLGREESRHALVMTVAAHATNVVLDYVFIVRLGLAAGGAGLATAISQYVMLVTATVLFSRSLISPGQPRDGGLLPAFHWREIAAPEAVGRLFRLNADILVRTVVLVSAFAVFLNFSALLGTIVLTANTILYRIQLLAAYFVDGAAFATETLAGVFHGSRDERSLERLRRLALRMGLLLTAPFALLVILVPRGLYGILTSHLETVETALSYNLWLLPALFLGSVIAVQAGSNHLLWLAISTFMAARSATLWWSDLRLSSSAGQPT
jgi:MATE family multidrug resistance protein